VTLFPVIRDWIVEFLDDNKDMTASMVGRNMLIEQVGRIFVKMLFVVYNDLLNLDVAVNKSNKTINSN